ncbi:MAG TPA: ATP-binding protein, partial [Rubrivivax sp.]|nr:ATP-binding protein [Rubrivivax sp.]
MEPPTLPAPHPESAESAARLRTLVAVRTVVLWHTSADGTVNRDNPSWQNYTGQSRSEYGGWGWLDAIHPEDRAAVDAAWHTAVASVQPLEISYRLRRHDGEYRVVSAQGAAVIEQGQVLEWVGICIDVTAAIQVESDLAANRERLRVLDMVSEATRALTDATAVMATTARILGEHLKATRCAYADVEADSNRFTIRSDWSLPGVPSSAGVYALDLFGPQATHNLRQGRHLVVNDVDAELGDEGGARMFNAIGIKAIICAGLVKEGRLVAMMAVHQATPRRWTAQDLAILAEVVERSWAHIERVRDHAALREQDRRKDEFLATLAHELRNPLAPMVYALAMLERSDDPVRQLHAREVLKRQTGHMSRLVDDLLDISRINSGLIQLQRETVGVRDLLTEAVETARPLLDAAQHRLALRLPDGNVQVHADRTRILQVVSNLLTNAIKYTPNGGLITLAAKASGGRAVIEVGDNGIGIHKDDQERIFEMFSQPAFSTGKSNGGLGIGLSLVKSLVALHEGSVSVHSEGPGQGARFQVELPLAEPASAPLEA